MSAETKDRVKRILRDCCGGGSSIATEIIHDEFVIIPRATIPTAHTEAGYVMAGDYEAALTDDMSIELAWRQARECISVAQFLESGAATRDARREELAAELFGGAKYSDLGFGAPKAIDRIIELEATK